jgi:hypothetical protein
MPTPAARDGVVVVTKVERLNWDRLPEPGLFRITFDESRMLQVRRDAANSQAPEGIDPHTTALRLLDLEAERELKARDLCNGGAKLVSPLTEGDGGSSASGIFKCRPPAF